MTGDPYKPSESFTVITTAGEEMEIVSKVGVADRIVLITAEDQRYVSRDSDGLVEPFDPDKHTGGLGVPDGTPLEWTQAADATDAADAREAFKNDLPADATDAAEAKAELETELTPQPVPGTPTTGTKKPPPEVMGGADGPLPSDVQTEEKAKKTSKVDGTTKSK